MTALLLAFLLLSAPIQIDPDAPVIVALSAYAGPVDLVYTAAGPERIAVTARSADADAPIDVTLALLDGDRLLAFDDDSGAVVSSLLPTDAHIARLDLPGAGVYTLRVHSFSGAQSGAVEVALAVLPTLPPCAIGQQTITLARGDTFRCALDLSRGARVSVTARDNSGTLDPLLTLHGSAGERLAVNDDHGDADVTLDALDARLTDVAVAAGTYIVTVVDFAGAAGTATLTIAISS
ncbi:MAG: DVUA0089 family protein [Aggregatilineales bacterium]